MHLHKEQRIHEMEFSVEPVSVSLLLCILLSLYFLIYSRTRRTVAKLPQIPPGSFGLPFIGETLHFLSAGKKGAPQNFVFDRINKYSSNIFRTSLFGERMVVIASPEGNKFLFSNENKLVKSWWPPHFDLIFNPSGVESNSMRLRQLFLPHLKPDVLKKYVPILDSETKRHLKTYWEGREVVTVSPLTKHYVFSIACRLFLGIKDQEIVARLEKPFAELINAFLTIPLNIPGTQLHSAIKAREKLHRDIKVLINQWKSDSSKGRLSASESFLNAVLQETFADEEISDKILPLLAATYDTASMAMTSITLYLAELHDVYDKVSAEQREIARSKRAGEMLNWEDIQRMRYSRSVASEVLRLHPPAPGAFREALCDITYDGFLIPKGWKIHWNAHAIHKNPKYFIEPEKFDPSRFDGDGPIPFSYVPFGGGPRVCPGQEYARTIILVFLHNIVTKFRWTKTIPNEKLVYNPTLKPTKDLPIYLYPHKSMC